MDKNFQSPAQGGLNLNTHPSVQPEGTSRCLLNVVVSADNTDEPFVTRERGNELCLQLPLGWRMYGHCYTTDNEVVVFLGDQTRSQIGLVGLDCGYEVLIDESCLNLTKWVDATFRVRRGCEDTIYFTDFQNPVRSVNISNLNKYRDENGDFDCNLLDLLRSFLVPCFARIDVLQTGGQVRYGSYNAVIQYLDENLNPTHSIYASTLVTVSDSDKGVFNVDTNPVIGKVSTRSIRFNMSGLDTTFPYYRLIVIEASGGTGVPNKYLVGTHQPTSNPTILFDGNPSNFKQTSLDEVINQAPIFNLARYIDQVENKLVLAHVSGSQYDYCNWQKFASKICTEYVIEEIDEDEYIRKGMAGNWDKTYMRDEVQPAGIVYVDKRGQHHPVFHIPGTAMNSNCACDFENIDCQQQSLLLKYSVLVDPTKASFFDLLVTITYTLNGQFYEVQKRVTGYTQKGEKNKIGQFEIDLLCFGDDLTGVNVRYEVFDPTSRFLNVGLSYELTVPSTPKTTGANLPPLLGWDDTVYPTWHADMSFLISLDQMMEAIDAYNKKAKVKVIYNDYSAKNLREIKKVPGLPRRWQIYNTAYKGGRMAYWECSNSFYENPYNCVDDYWGVDSCGNSLEGQPIRHHRFPDATLEPINTSTTLAPGEVSTVVRNKVRRLGLKFSNIEYPHPDIVGHYFVFGERDVFNRTVIDKGICNPLADGHINIYGKKVEGFSYLQKYDSVDNNWYVSPKFLLGTDSIAGTHLKLENQINSIEHPIGVLEYISEVHTIRDLRVFIDALIFDQVGVSDPRRVNLKIEDSYALEPATSIEKSDRVVGNLSLTTKVGFIRTDETLSKIIDPNEGNCLSGSNYKRIAAPYKLVYAAIKNNIDVHCNLDTITYYRGHDCMLTGTESEVYGGDVFLTRFDFASVLLREQYDLFKELFGSGDPIFKRLFSQGVFTQIVRNDCFDDLITDPLFIEFSGELMSVWVESDVSYDLRSEGNTDETVVLRPTRHVNRLNAKDALEQLINYFRIKLTTQKADEDGVVYPVRDVPLQEFYSYNFDYSRNNRESIYVGLPRSYDCCSQCFELFPNRIHYSETSFTEELTDNFKVFKANNFKDLSADKGPITDIFRDGNSIVAHTTEGFWSFPYGYQEVPRQDIVSFIGDGAFMALPPKLHIDSETGSGGSLNRQSTVKTPYGVFFVDELSSVPYLYTGKLEDLSGDMSSWFQKNLISHLRNEIKGDLAEFVYNISTYDETNNRVIFTKLDYGVKFPARQYRFETGKFYHNDTEVDLRDSTYFTNLSFTCSYSFKTKMWYWHSYLPEYYIHNKNYFSAFFKAGLWRFNSKDFNNYFGEQHPFIVELIIGQSEETKVFNDIEIHLVTKKESSKGFSETLDFFDSFIVYNDSQSSGILPLKIDETLLDSLANDSRVNRRQKDWNLNQFRDMVVNSEPLFIESKELIDLPYFIDKIPNDNATDKNKPWFEQAPFRDKYIATRLFLTGKKDIQFIVKLLAITASDPK